jgi:hypothetical protein
MALCVILLAACTSTRLTVNVDIYDEDPRLTAPMSPEEATQLVADLEQLRLEAFRNESERRFLAERSFKIYENTWTKLGGNEAYLERYRAELDAYLTSLSNGLAAVSNAIKNAEHCLESYNAMYLGAYETAKTEFEGQDLNRQLKEEEARPPRWWRRSDPPAPRLGEEWIIRRLPGSLHGEEAKARKLVALAATEFEKFLTSEHTDYSMDWNELRNILYRAYEASQLDGDEVLESRVTGAFETLRTGILNLAEWSNKESRQTIDISTLRSGKQNKALFDSTIQIALELETLRNNLPKSAAALTALSGLVRSSARLYEMIDRLQDAGDPVWRIVADPANESRWNKTFSETYYYAEGNSSVVVVRDNPMRYRVQEATNDPSALIKGQLEITRAVTSAAIAVAGAATGMPSHALPGADEELPDSSTPDTQSQDLARRKADADISARLRDSTLRSLAQDLSGILISLSAAEVNEALIDSQAQLLRAKLEGYKATLESQPD